MNGENQNRDLMLYVVHATYQTGTQVCFGMLAGPDDDVEERAEALATLGTNTEVMCLIATPLDEPIGYGPVTDENGGLRYYRLVAEEITMSADEIATLDDERKAQVDAMQGSALPAEDDPEGWLDRVLNRLLN